MPSGRRSSSGSTGRGSRTWSSASANWPTSRSRPCPPPLTTRPPRPTASTVSARCSSTWRGGGAGGARPRARRPRSSCASRPLIRAAGRHRVCPDPPLRRWRCDGCRSPGHDPRPGRGLGAARLSPPLAAQARMVLADARSHFTVPADLTRVERAATWAEVVDGDEAATAPVSMGTVDPGFQRDVASRRRPGS